jgi:hypothetical protein
MAKHRYLASVTIFFMLAAPLFAEKEKKPHRIQKLAAAVYLSAEFDAATTYHLLQNCGNRCYEANPMIRPFARNPSIFVVVGASALTVNYFAGKLKKRGHPKWAKALQVLTIGAHAGAGAYGLALQH